MSKLAFFVPGYPAAKERPRHGQGRTFTPAATRRNEESIRWYAERALRAAGLQPLSGPIQVTIVAVYARPKSWPKSIGPERLPKLTRPDLDNIKKLVLDGLNPRRDKRTGLWAGGVWKDDARVFKGIAEKWWAAVSEDEGVYVTVEEVQTCVRF